MYYIAVLYTAYVLRLPVCDCPRSPHSPCPCRCTSPPLCQVAQYATKTSLR